MLQESFCVFLLEIFRAFFVLQLFKQQFAKLTIKVNFW
jgi:hypothetical protein